ncbi:TlpA family protein disulfide reductase [Bacteroidetes/Chlorobi group bacterium Naka2016]|jgi:thiol-disulfide isomerase/thioredoxin|nr:MAG: TlpA family protein disulfide reductase [Bacteroidetes/Chlorobi group bacterium Naka2016]
MFNRAVLILILLFAFTFNFCRSESKENTETKDEFVEVTKLSQNENLSETNNQSPKFEPLVFLPRSITPAKPGNIVDFVWVQNGKEVKFSDYVKGKIVLLNFWGTWCPPCRREIPDLIEVHNEGESRDFLVVGITLERDIENAETNVKDFAKQKGIKYLNIIDKDQSIARAYGGINAVPTTFIINKQGKIVETLVGARMKQDFIDAINRARK